jgi:protein-disulfide isomerase
VLGTEPTLIENYVKTGQVLLVFNPVLNHGDRSDQSHQAAECAAEQDQFWAFHHFLFENQDGLWSGDVRESLKILAADFGLDTASFNTCLDEQRYLATVKAQDTRRIERGIPYQPSFEINDEFLIGSQPVEVFQKVLDTHLGL